VVSYRWSIIIILTACTSLEIDAGVQRTHGGQRDPEVAELQQEVEDGVLHVLDVCRYTTV